VASNSRLRGDLAAGCAAEGLSFHCPPPVYCTDNAAMIACRAYYQHQAGDWAGMDLNAVPALRLNETGQ
jgi:Metal-dependent proteases with possible chaperone activity